MGRRLRAACACIAALLLSGCPELPRSFSEIPLDRVGALVAGGTVEVIEALDSNGSGPIVYPGARRWNPSTDPARPPRDVRGALVVGESPEVAFRAAAAIARSEYDPVYVFIPRNREERRALLALALRREEQPRGQDS
jgi:hypothetical protein